MTDAVLTIAHGTVDHVDELPAFLKVIRRGHDAPPELVTEVTRRYNAIGGRSPLNDICREVTRALGARLGLRAAYAGRLWAPKAESVLAELLAQGVTRVFVIPLAQHSAPLYVETVRTAAKALADRAGTSASSLAVIGTGNWGQEEELTRAFARSLARAIDEIPASVRPFARVLLSAHSLPLVVLRSGDPYEQEVRTSAASVARAVGPSMLAHEVIFQSQGMSGGEWLGPDVRATLDRLKTEGVKHVVFAPIGFLADHVEVLYDLDIEARGWADERGMTYSRMGSLNATEGLVDALHAVTRRLLP